MKFDKFNVIFLNVCHLIKFILTLQNEVPTKYNPNALIDVRYHDVISVVSVVQQSHQRVGDSAPSCVIHPS